MVNKSSKVYTKNQRLKLANRKTQNGYNLSGRQLARFQTFLKDRATEMNGNSSASLLKKSLRKKQPCFLKSTAKCYLKRNIWSLLAQPSTFTSLLNGKLRQIVLERNMLTLERAH